MGATIEALFLNQNSLTKPCAETQIVDFITKGNKWKIPKNLSFSQFKRKPLPTFRWGNRIERKFDFPELNLKEGLQKVEYPDFGLVIFRSNQLYLAVSLIPNGQGGNGGHAHNDVLSYELMIGGKNIVRDAGTYLYTAIPKKRNEYRRTDAHHLPKVVGEQNKFEVSRLGLFRMKEEIQIGVVELEETKADIYYTSVEHNLRLELEISNHRLTLVYSSDQELSEKKRKFELF